MSRLIDADKLPKYTGYALSASDVAIAVENAPTVDAVPVCRCKDCRYSREPNRHDRGENSACEGVLICCVGFDHVYPSSDDGLIFVDKNGYCSHGERKGGDGEP